MGNTCIGGIQWDTDPELLLQAEEVSDLATKLSSGSMADIETEIINKINAEKSNGLSIDAYNVDGRAPYNELAKELSGRMTNSNAKVDQAREAILKNGIKHRKEEANRLWEEVIKEHSLRYNTLKNAITAYNVYNWTEKKYTTDPYTNQTTSTTHKVPFEKLSLTDYNDSSCATIIGTIKPNHPKGGDVEKAYSTYEEFFKTYVRRAKIYKDECDSGDLSVGLEKAYKQFNYVPSTDGTDVDPRLEGKTPVQELAKAVDDVTVDEVKVNTEEVYNIPIV